MDVRRKHLWGARYIDELVQVAVNTDPAADNTCDPPSRRPLRRAGANYYAMQNLPAGQAGANFNPPSPRRWLRRAGVLGITDPNGVLVERYEYTPYGQRTVYSKAGPDDALTTAPLYHSQQLATATARHPYTLCDIGHQGLMHDREFRLVQNRFRYRSPLVGRWPQRDPLDYIDGTSLYEHVESEPCRNNDPSGLTTLSSLPPLWISGSAQDDCACMWKKYGRGPSALSADTVIADAWDSAYNMLTEARNNLRGWTIKGDPNHYLFVSWDELGGPGCRPHEPTIKRLFKLRKYYETMAPVARAAQRKDPTFVRREDLSPITPERMERFRKDLVASISKQMAFLHSHAFDIECADDSDEQCFGEAYVNRKDSRGFRTITLCPGFWRISNAQRARTMLHEGSHFEPDGGLGTTHVPQREFFGGVWSFLLSDADVYEEWVVTAAEQNHAPRCKY